MVRSVAQHSDVPFELLIGDASAPSQRFACDDPRVRVIPEDPPLGPPRGYNALYRQARGRWICWLNDDLEVPPGWGAALIGAIEHHVEVDLFCLPVIERGASEALLLLYLGLPYACMGAVRREAGEALGWLDEGYGFYATDPDFALRMIASGRRLAPAVGAHVFHHHLKDEARVANTPHFERDNARLGRLWHPRRRALRRLYRRSSFRYFRDLETRWSEAWRCQALEVPLDPSAAPRPPNRPHRVKAPGWWLGI
jgi:GT2 family glycosyltransferase